MHLRLSSVLTSLSLCTTLATSPATAQVGFTQLQLAGMPVTLVYPTDAKAAPLTIGAFEIEVAVGAPPAAPPAGRWPLVVTSHGTAGSPLPDHGLAAALARGGFVVAQPLHAGDNFRDASKAGPESWITRPAEVRRLIDALAAHPQWGERIATERVAVHGTSAGGVTALSLAGAQWRTLALLEHCNAHLEADIGFCFNGTPDAAAQARRRASFERARGVPERFLPAEVTAWQGGQSPASDTAAGFDPRPDPRIASVSLSVPVAAIFSAASLARVQIPVGLIAARSDRMLVPQFHSDHVRQHCKSCTVLADLPRAAHFDVMHPWPAAVAAEVTRLQTRGVETDPAFDARLRDEAYARVVQFHRRHLGLWGPVGMAAR
jgi:predicted dienelactone hydrolase